MKLTKLLQGLAATGIVLLTCIAPVQADERDGQLAFLRGAADEGDSAAQFTLANHYYRGLGVQQDLEKALALYSKAADQGLAAAENRLGIIYERGLGVPQSYGRAMTFYRKAAVQGNALAQFNLGMLYETGKG